VNGETRPLPDALRRAIIDDLRPVRPLRPPWQRALVVGVWFAGILIAAPMLLGLRADRGELGAIWMWGPTVLQLFVGLGLIHGALREAVPGLGLPRRLLWAAVIGATALEITVAMVTWRMSPIAGTGLSWLGVGCARSEALVGLPALVITVLLAARAYPVRPARAGLLGGLGCGLFADGIQHLHCPLSDLRHVLVWHLGGMAALALTGLLTGAAWSRWQRRTLS
jgi:hypothetical protein